MSDAGYTLVETLAALAIVALAVSGLAAGVDVLARWHDRVNRRIADVEAVRAAEMAVRRSLEGQGPFRSHEPDRFAGSPTGFRFACGEARPCEVALASASDGAALRLEAAGRVRLMALRTDAPLRFRYEGVRASSGVWPPAGEGRQALRSVWLEREDGVALLNARVWQAQPAACQFDVILQDCR